VVYPLANLLATEQVQLGDLVRIDWDGQHPGLTFVREGEGALVHSPPAEVLPLVATTEVQDGRSTNAPAEVVVESRKSRAALPSATPVAAPQARKKQDRVNL
jgi:hypothetical protein